ncbi:restriction endonuclease subunit S [Brucella cytisi]|uniref:Type I restriction modification DNA specificity domain-containing protein n=1 Tax=Brucella cytisi TaxID=407152 RepID=A0A1J6HDQ5_9HYPH|nr:restriction endonuclease subunit S [Brucella cytisi]OIS90673.1 hypothetical protein BLA27_25415 [Brucella cytisi]
MSREVPEGWRDTSLGELILEMKGGGTPSRKIQRYWEGPIPWASVKDLKKPYLNATEEYISEDGLSASASNIIPQGTIIIATRMAVGRAVRFSCDVAINQDLRAIFPKNELDINYLHHWLRWRETEISRLGSGTTVAGIRQEVLKGLSFRIPPLHEQHKIAEVISSIDDAIAATQAVIEQTKKVKQATLEHLLTKGIGHTRFKQTEIGEIPEEWQVLSFNELLLSDDITKIQDGNHGEIHPTTSDYQPTGIPFIMARDLIDGSVDINNCAFISKELAESLRVGKSYAGDILLTHKGTIGRVAITPDVADYIMLTPQVTLYRVKDDGAIISAYLRDALENEPFQSALLKVSDQSTRKYVGITEQKKIKIPVPSIREQHRICKIAQDLRDIERENSNLLDKLRKVKSALMSDLLTGRKRVTDTLPLAAE